MVTKPPVPYNNEMSEIVAPHREDHKSHRSNWLRAAVLGANDGIVSTASLMLGVSAANASNATILTAGIAGLAAGALSMAAGEYVSVSSQKDSEHADMAIERRSLVANPEEELAELAHIYVHRGLEPSLAKKVAQQLHDHDAEAAHMRDELGINQNDMANPIQAAAASALSFTIGATLPIIAILVSPKNMDASFIVALSLIGLAVSGGIGAYLGGGHKVRAASRVLIGGGIAMTITSLIGHLVGTI